MPGMRHINHFFNVSIFHLKLVLFYFENSCCHNFHSKIVQIDQKYLLSPILAAILFFLTVFTKNLEFHRFSSNRFFVYFSERARPIVRKIKC